MIKDRIPTEQNSSPDYQALAIQALVSLEERMRTDFPDNPVGADFLSDLKKKTEDAISSRDASSNEWHIRNVAVGLRLILNGLDIAQKEGEVINPEDLRKSKFEVLNGYDLGSEDVAAMKKICAGNFADRPDGFAQAVVEKFDHIAEVNEQTSITFYIFRLAGEIAAFNSFTDDGEDREGRHYQKFGAFHVAGKLRGGGLGKNFMEASLDYEARDLGNIIVAECSRNEDIAMSYIERGFIGYKPFEYKGEPGLNIELDIKGNSIWRGKKMTRPEIIAHTKRGEELGSGDDGFFAEEVADVKDVSFERADQKGLVLTRYFREGGKVYAIFEEDIRARSEDGGDPSREENTGQDPVAWVFSECTTILRLDRST